MLSPSVSIPSAWASVTARSPVVTGYSCALAGLMLANAIDAAQMNPVAVAIRRFIPSPKIGLLIRIDLSGVDLNSGNAKNALDFRYSRRRLRGSAVMGWRETTKPYPLERLTAHPTTRIDYVNRGIGHFSNIYV